MKCCNLLRVLNPWDEGEWEKCLSYVWVCLSNFKQSCYTEIVALWAVYLLRVVGPFPGFLMMMWSSHIFSCLFTSCLRVWNQRLLGFSGSKYLNLTSLCERGREWVLLRVHTHHIDFCRVFPKMFVRVLKHHNTEFNFKHYRTYFSFPSTIIFFVHLVSLRKKLPSPSISN